MSDSSTTTALAAQPPHQSSGLLKLPLEVEHEIFGYLIGSADGKILIKRRRSYVSSTSEDGQIVVPQYLAIRKYQIPGNSDVSSLCHVTPIPTNVVQYKSSPSISYMFANSCDIMD